MLDCGTWRRHRAWTPSSPTRARLLGASFAGRKAMTATSGPGLSLMAELVGLVPEAAMAGYPTDVPLRDYDAARHLIERRLAALGR